MSICIALGMILYRSIHAFYIKKRGGKREQERFSSSEQSHGSAQSLAGQEYQHEHPGEERSSDSDHGHDSFANRTVDLLETEVVDAPPMYDYGAARLPPYDGPRRSRRQREGSHGARQIYARARACTGMRVVVNRDQGGGGAVIWYDALEDRYEVISPPYMLL